MACISISFTTFSFFDHKSSKFQMLKNNPSIERILIIGYHNKWNKHDWIFSYKTKVINEPRRFSSMFYWKNASVTWQSTWNLRTPMRYRIKMSSLVEHSWRVTTSGNVSISRRGPAYFLPKAKNERNSLTSY